jgi:hypothetical protein
VLHIRVVSMAELVRIMELVYPIPMRFTVGASRFSASFSATGATDICSATIARFEAHRLALAKLAKKEQDVPRVAGARDRKERGVLSVP